MTPAGPIEEQPDAPTIESATAWQLFIALLERVGVDKMTAHTANIHINSDAVRGVVLVGGFPRDEKGRVIIDGAGVDAHLRTYSSKYHFTRESP